MSVALDSNRISHFPSQAAGGGRSTRLYGLPAGAAGTGGTAPRRTAPVALADYFSHWLRIGATAPDPGKLPKIFYVNWFRKGEDGKFLWPGYGENSRVLEWIFNRVVGEGEAVDTPIGAVPAPGGIDIENIDVSKEDMGVLLRVDAESWRAESAHP